MKCKDYMELEQYVYNALQQLKQGETIGRRGTPVISFWPMRQKWEKWGSAWETRGTDGDMLFEDNTIVIPAILQLVYFRNEDTVCQLAYVLYPEVKGANGIYEAEAKFNEARSYMPKSLDSGLTTGVVSR